MVPDTKMAPCPYVGGWHFHCLRFSFMKSDTFDLAHHCFHTTFLICNSKTTELGTEFEGPVPSVSNSLPFLCLAFQTIFASFICHCI